MVNFRSYAKDVVNSTLKESKITLTFNEIASIVDSVIFDWNEIGDQEADFQDIVEWNIDQYLTHN